ncbi:MAG: glycosyltransferase family 2 protein [Planctomycetes bacterium]|nr:glycosyltransferase family 2 protein [Planctomycetota bacterium]
MYRGRRIGLVIPARNEERLVGPTLESVPEMVDEILVVNDGSKDRTGDVVSERAQLDPRIRLVAHEKNQGPGAAVISGYLEAARDQCDIVVVAGGDNQMPMDQMERLLDPLVEGQADYAKGNRFLEGGNVFEDMPLVRIVGNMMISALTKIASGYYKLVDVVDGFTAITRQAIERVDWKKAWKGYGYPMNFLILLNYHGFRVVDVPRRAIYLKGERQSQIRGVRYALRVSPMLMRGFFWRIFYKYCIRSFHPLFFFYCLGMLLVPAGLLHGTWLVWRQIAGLGVSGPQAILCALFLITGSQFLLFGMLFDMEESIGR